MERPVPIVLEFHLHQDGSVYWNHPTGLRRVDSEDLIGMVHLEYRRTVSKMKLEQRRAAFFARFRALFPKEVDTTERKDA
jgi:hypothetical protein